MTSPESLEAADEIGLSIDLDLPRKLQDPEYRKKFFQAEESAHIAAQLISLRKRRALNQNQVADLLETKQPAISRLEQADYQNRNFSTIQAYADALGARVRVYIEPYEDVIHEYENNTVSVRPESVSNTETVTASLLGLTATVDQNSFDALFDPINRERLDAPELTLYVNQSTVGPFSYGTLSLPVTKTDEDTFLANIIMPEISNGR